MSEKKFTIGMATYDDYDGVYFSIQSIRLCNPEIMNDVEFVIIDNNPESSHAKALKHFSNKTVAQRSLWGVSKIYLQ